MTLTLNCVTGVYSTYIIEKAFKTLSEFNATCGATKGHRIRSADFNLYWEFRGYNFMLF